MTRIRTLATAGGALLIALAGACGSGASKAPRALEVQHAWARTTPPGARDGVAYAVIVSPIDDVLAGASVSPTVALAVELHESMGSGGGSSMANMPAMADAGGGEMRMVPLERVLLPARKPVAFAPGGKHLMLSGLVRPLAAGDAFTLTLRFAHAGTADVRVEVRDNPP